MVRVLKKNGKISPELMRASVAFLDAVTRGGQRRLLKHFYRALSFLRRYEKVTKRRSAVDCTEWGKLRVPFFMLRHPRAAYRTRNVRIWPRSGWKSVRWLPTVLRPAWHPPRRARRPAAHAGAGLNPRAYPFYTVVAEKLEAAVRLGLANTRLKDFFDLWHLSRHFSFDGPQLATALTRTFARREMTLPTGTPAGLTDEFATLRAPQWTAFVRRNALGSVELSAVLQAVRAFALPPLRAAATQAAFVRRWTRADGWRQV